MSNKNKLIFKKGKFSDWAMCMCDLGIETHTWYDCCVYGYGHH